MASPARDHDDDPEYDYDWVVVGSGFGGSVAAHRLTEKGYRVAVLESGKRFADDDFPRSTWDLRRYFFAPRLGLHGIFRLSLFKDVSVVSGGSVLCVAIVFAARRQQARRSEDDRGSGGVTTRVSPERPTRAPGVTTCRLAPSRSGGKSRTA